VYIIDDGTNEQMLWSSLTALVDEERAKRKTEREIGAIRLDIDKLSIGQPAMVHIIIYHNYIYQ
jgi:hypothetical protein